MQADGDRGEDRRCSRRPTAVERLFHMFEAGLHRDSVTRQQRPLRRRTGEPFERGKAVRGCELADRVHPRIEVERREARAGIADFGNAQVRPRRVASSAGQSPFEPPVERRLTQKVKGALRGVFQLTESAHVRHGAPPHERRQAAFFFQAFGTVRWPSRQPSRSSSSAARTRASSM